MVPRTPFGKKIDTLKEPTAISLHAFKKDVVAVCERVAIGGELIAVVVDADRRFLMIDAPRLHWLYRMEFWAADSGTTDEEWKTLIANHPVATPLDCVSRGLTRSLFEYEREVCFDALLTEEALEHLQPDPTLPFGTYVHAVEESPVAGPHETMLYAVDGRYWGQLLDYLSCRVQIASGKHDTPALDDVSFRVSVSLSQIHKKRQAILEALASGDPVVIEKHSYPSFIIEPRSKLSPVLEAGSILLSELQTNAKRVRRRLESESEFLAIRTRTSDAVGYVRRA